MKDALDLKKTIQEVVSPSIPFPFSFFLKSFFGKIRVCFKILNEMTLLQAKYLAEAVGAGMGSSLQGFVGRVL